MVHSRRRVKGRTRRSKLAISTIVGAVLFFGLAITLVNFFYEVARAQIEINQFDSQRTREDIDVKLEQLLLTETGRLKLFIVNGPLPATIVRLWITNETASPKQHVAFDFEVRLLPFQVGQFEFDGTCADGSATCDDINKLPDFILADETEHTIRMITARGNAIAPEPFTVTEGVIIQQGGFELLELSAAIEGGAGGGARTPALYMMVPYPSGIGAGGQVKPIHYAVIIDNPTSEDITVNTVDIDAISTFAASRLEFLPNP